MSIDALHQLVRRRVIRRHGRVILRKRIEHSRLRIDQDGTIGRAGPARVVLFLTDQTLGIGVGLTTIKPSMASSLTECSDDKQHHQSEQGDQMRKSDRAIWFSQ